MSRLPPGRDRALRIELLRARAAIERQSLSQGVRQLGDSITPRGLLQSFLPGTQGGGGSPVQLLLRLVRLTRRYPLVLSLGSSLLAVVGRRRSFLGKLAMGALVVWKIAGDKRNKPS